MLEGC